MIEVKMKMSGMMIKRAQISEDDEDEQCNRHGGVLCAQGSRIGYTEPDWSRSAMESAPAMVSTIPST